MDQDKIYDGFNVMNMFIKRDTLQYFLNFRTVFEVEQLSKIVGDKKHFFIVLFVKMKQISFSLC